MVSTSRKHTATLSSRGLQECRMVLQNERNIRVLKILWLNSTQNSGTGFKVWYPEWLQRKATLVYWVWWIVPLNKNPTVEISTDSASTGCSQTIKWSNLNAFFKLTRATVRVPNWRRQSPELHQLQSTILAPTIVTDDDQQPMTSTNFVLFHKACWPGRYTNQNR